MANIGTLQSEMTDLWEEEAFWGFFSPASPGEKKAELLARLQEEHEISVTIEAKNILENLRKYIPEDKLQAVYKADYLDGTGQYFPTRCILKEKEPDSATTISRYVEDESLAIALAMLFPTREIHCHWFVDGMGDYGSYALLGGEVLNETSGNLQEDLAAMNHKEDPQEATGPTEPEYVHLEFETMDPDSDELPF